MPIRCITSRKDVPRRHSTLGSHRLEEPRNGFSNDLCPPIKKLFKYQKSFSCFSYSFWLWPPMAKSAEIDYSGGSEINSNACLFSVVLTTTQLGPMQDVAEKHVISLPFSGNEKATLKVLLWNTWILTQMHESPHYQPVIKGHFWVFLRKPPDHRDIVDSDLHCLGTPKPGLPLLPPARGVLQRPGQEAHTRWSEVWCQGPLSTSAPNLFLPQIRSGTRFTKKPDY